MTSTLREYELLDIKGGVLKAKTTSEKSIQDSQLLKEGKSRGVKES